MVQSPTQVIARFSEPFNTLSSQCFLHNNNTNMCVRQSRTHIECWLATARQEKIVNLKGMNGYNPW